MRRANVANVRCVGRKILGLASRGFMLLPHYSCPRSSPRPFRLSRHVGCLIQFSGDI
jgi:hypothetical protein